MKFISNKKNLGNGRNQKDKSSPQKQAYSSVNTNKAGGKGRNPRFSNNSGSSIDTSVGSGTRNMGTTPSWDNRKARELSERNNKIDAVSGAAPSISEAEKKKKKLPKYSVSKVPTISPEEVAKKKKGKGTDLTTGVRKDDKEQLVNKEKLTEVMGATGHFQKNSVDDSMVESLNTTLQDYNIKDTKEIQMFLAASMHESRHSLTEAGWNSDDVVRNHCKQYEPDKNAGKNLGNTQVGDGYKYRGAGYIQLTGRGNYTDFANHIEEKYGAADPKILDEGTSHVADNYAWEAAGYFWERDNISEVIQKGQENGLADEEIFKKVSNAIYHGNAEAKGDPYGWEKERKVRYNEVINTYN